MMKFDRFLSIVFGCFFVCCLNSCTDNSKEQLFIKRWHTVQNVNENQNIKDPFSNYLEFKEDYTFQIIMKENIFRSGEWRYDADMNINIDLQKSKRK